MDCPATDPPIPYCIMYLPVRHLYFLCGPEGVLSYDPSFIFRIFFFYLILFLDDFPILKLSKSLIFNFISPFKIHCLSKNLRHL